VRACAGVILRSLRFGINIGSAGGNVDWPTAGGDANARIDTNTRTLPATLRAKRPAYRNEPLDIDITLD